MFTPIVIIFLKKNLKLITISKKKERKIERKKEGKG